MWVDTRGVAVTWAGTTTATWALMISRTEELKDRIKAKKSELESRYSELKADTRSEARVERDSVKSKLEELQEHLRDGWDKLTDTVSAKLNDWLDRK